VGLGGAMQRLKKNREIRVPGYVFCNRKHGLPTLPQCAPLGRVAFCTSRAFPRLQSATGKTSTYIAGLKIEDVLNFDCRFCFAFTFSD